MSCCPFFDPERLPRSLAEGLRMELFLTPKPGLVDLLDNGSHPDLSSARMLASIDLVEKYLKDLAGKLRAGDSLPELIAAGRRAEEKMLSALETNTHRGAIFLTGLLLTARSRCGGSGEAELRREIARLAREIRTASPPVYTHGAEVRQRFAASGILGEARRGLPSLFETALPALRGALARGDSLHRAALGAMAALMEVVEDTTALYRCGPPGLERLRADGRRIREAFGRGEDPVPLLVHLNILYRQLHLTMGGVADLLGLALGWMHFRQEFSVHAWSGSKRGVLLPSP